MSLYLALPVQTLISDQHSHSFLPGYDKLIKVWELLRFYSTLLKEESEAVVDKFVNLSKLDLSQADLSV